MKKKLSNLLFAISIVMIIWFGVSVLEIANKNMYSKDYSEYNLIIMISNLME
jgi:hypothetical protein